ncbi:MAG: TetR/AcrR family transcriptional regulator [Chloroflexi bacterium]|nr:MAG: TetR/AcrR family transcriptional regulator [Chloroflexota bacterium]
MTKVDRRIKRTQRLLGDSLIALMLEKGYENVTIKDITEHADVAYVTFFRHYKDKDELLTARLNELITELAERINELAQAEIGEAAIQIAFEHARDNQQLYRVLFSSPGTVRVREELKTIYAERLIQTCAPRAPEGSVIPFEIAANHIAAATFELIHWWLKHDMPYSTQKMGRIYLELVERATWQALQITETEPYSES